MEGTLSLAISGGVAMVTLNRPAQRNAMSALLVEELMAVLHRLDADPAVRAVVLVGSGTGFCAGSDLVGLANMTPGERESFEAQSGQLARVIPRMAVPVVAAVHGFAIGGGLTLAAACDVVVTEADAKWSLPEVPIGLFPAWGLSAVEARVGRAAARRLAWGCETLDGTAAFRLGLADHLSDGTALTAARALAEALARLPSSQSAAVKQYFSATDDGAPADEMALRLFVEAARTEEAAACFLRFAGKEESRRKAFFSEEKNQKTFIRSHVSAQRTARSVLPATSLFVFAILHLLLRDRQRIGTLRLQAWCVEQAFPLAAVQDADFINTTCNAPAAVEIGGEVSLKVVCANRKPLETESPAVRGSEFDSYAAEAADRGTWRQRARLAAPGACAIGTSDVGAKVPYVS